jgi:hypothetical protein
VTDHRAAVADKEWKIVTGSVNKARQYSPKHGHDAANVKAFNRMFAETD